MVSGAKLDELVAKVRELDMDEVRRKVEERGTPEPGAGEAEGA
jgi:hypothetical protein